MKRSALYVAVALAFGLGLGLPSHSTSATKQGPGPYIENPPSPPLIEKDIVARGSLMLERPVHNTQGVLLGTSKDLVIGTNGRLAYLVIERGSAFGLVGPLIPIPWSLVRVKDLGKSLEVDLSTDAIRNAPGFSNQKWPDFFSAETLDKIEKFYQPRH